MFAPDRPSDRRQELKVSKGMGDLGTPIGAPTSTTPVAIDAPFTLCVVPFRLASGHLEVGTVRHADGSVALPAGSPAREEPLDAGARRIINGHPGHGEEYLEQLYTFSADAGHDRPIVVSYIALFREAACADIAIPDLHWSSLDGLRLTHDIDSAVLQYAVVRLRAKLGYTNIAFHLMPITFTLTELQQAYESVLQHPVDKRNFRRRMMVPGTLEDTGEKRREGSHRPAALHRFASRDDQAAYLTPSWASERIDPLRDPGE
jgi:8-oxo-dGTP diphosphatase